MIKSEKAITLISLAIYIIGLIVIMRIVGSLLLFYNNNVIKMNDTSDVNMELSKFTAKMIDETKEAGNTITEVAETTIKFSNGNVYTFQDNKIYENSIVVSQYVKEFLANLEIDGNKQILRIYIILEKGAKETTKNLSYVIEETEGKVAAGPTYVIDVEKGVYGNLYKISDTEYHLIFNTTGAIAQGYSKEQLVEKGTNIKNGSSRKQISEGVYISGQPWGAYSENITKVKIEEEIRPTKTTFYFYGLSEITEIEGIDNINTRNITEMWHMFSGCSKLSSLDVSAWNMSNVTSIGYMFYKCSSLTSIDVGNWNIENVTNMQNMFSECTQLENINVATWNTGKVTTMANVFLNCSNLTKVDVSKWDTSHVKEMWQMFSGCSKLATIDVSAWDMSSVTSIGLMFYKCSSLTSIDAGKWNTENVTGMTSLFSGCTQLKYINVSNWNTENVTGMSNVFANCSSLTSLDISNWNTNNVTIMWEMFYNCSKLTKIYVGENWSTSAVTSSTGMFYGCTALSGAISYDSTKIDATYANYTSGYLTYKAN